MSTSSAPVSVLVTGYGHSGSAILNALLSPPFHDRIRTFLLVRPSALQDEKKRQTIDGFKTKGATIVEGDLEKDGVEELTRKLQAHSIATVISAISGYPETLKVQQLPLIRAAAAAGVRHFIPSEYGVDWSVIPPNSLIAPQLQAKIDSLDAIKQAGMDWTVVNSSAFAEFITDIAFFGVDVEHSSVDAAGSFDTKFCISALKDVGFVVASAVLDPEARNSRVYVGEVVSFGQITDILEEATGRKFTRRVKSVDEAVKAVKANPSDLPSRFVPLFVAENGTWWPVAQTYLAQHPSAHHKPTPFAEFARQKFQADK